MTQETFSLPLDEYQRLVLDNQIAIMNALANGNTDRYARGTLGDSCNTTQRMLKFGSYKTPTENMRIINAQHKLARAQAPDDVAGHPPASGNARNDQAQIIVTHGPSTQEMRQAVVFTWVARVLKQTFADHDFVAVAEFESEVRVTITNCRNTFFLVRRADCGDAGSIPLVHTLDPLAVRGLWSVLNVAGLTATLDCKGGRHNLFLSVSLRRTRP